ncbi:RNA exonuclease [Planoprotostelium fungivorum]|uniref:RNA exonuclease n=1 Tax=Planoprotostelium fungivorum TaxID=1890364 RepID=A0A2P6NZW1_9EUKA|nr:RNA exonuclease [Planoprotostelium fungivorum]
MNSSSGAPQLQQMTELLQILQRSNPGASSLNNSINTAQQPTPFPPAVVPTMPSFNPTSLLASLLANNANTPTINNLNTPVMNNINTQPSTNTSQPMNNQLLTVLLQKKAELMGQNGTMQSQNVMQPSPLLSMGLNLPQTSTTLPLSMPNGNQFSGAIPMNFYNPQAQAAQLHLLQMQLQQLQGNTNPNMSQEQNQNGSSSSNPMNYPQMGYGCNNGNKTSQNADPRPNREKSETQMQQKGDESDDGFDYLDVIEESARKKPKLLLAKEKPEKKIGIIQKPEKKIEIIQKPSIVRSRLTVSRGKTESSTTNGVQPITPPNFKDKSTGSPTTTKSKDSTGDTKPKEKEEKSQITPIMRTASLHRLNTSLSKLMKAQTDKVAEKSKKIEEAIYNASITKEYYNKITDSYINRLASQMPGEIPVPLFKRENSNLQSPMKSKFVSVDEPPSRPSAASSFLPSKRPPSTTPLTAIKSSTKPAQPVQRGMTAAMKAQGTYRPLVDLDARDKIGNLVRQKYLDKIYDKIVPLFPYQFVEAARVAKMEEETLYKNAKNKNGYQMLAIALFKRLSGPNPLSRDAPKVEEEKLPHIIPPIAFDVTQLIQPPSHYLLTERELEELDYPRQPEERISPREPESVFKCVRCSRDFSYRFDAEDKLIREEYCIYHNGKSRMFQGEGGKRRVYSCCGDPKTAPGCTKGCHVPDKGTSKQMMEAGILFYKTKPVLEVTGSSTLPPHRGMIAIDCEMVYTIEGSELARVTLVDEENKPLFDRLIKPENEVVDYNSQFSGITEETLEKVTTRLHDIREDLMKIIFAETILVGQSLQQDLKALRIIHDRIIDTCVMYQSTTMPYRRSLKELTSRYLNIFIQQSASGHDSCEDAAAAMSLARMKILKGEHHSSSHLSPLTSSRTILWTILLINVCHVWVVLCQLVTEPSKSRRTRGSFRAEKNRWFSQYTNTMISTRSAVLLLCFTFVLARSYRPDVAPSAAFIAEVSVDGLDDTAFHGSLQTDGSTHRVLSRLDRNEQYYWILQDDGTTKMYYNLNGDCTITTRKRRFSWVLKPEQSFFVPGAGQDLRKNPADVWTTPRDDKGVIMHTVTVSNQDPRSPVEFVYNMGTDTYVVHFLKFKKGSTQLSPIYNPPQNCTAARPFPASALHF